MKNVIVRYGVYASLLLVVMFIASFAVAETNYELSEILGYAAIILSMVFVFLGIRQYRDEVGGGKISFWQALKVGLMIVAIPSVVFGLFDLIYVLFINPDFMENYYAHTLEKMKASLSEAEYVKRAAEMEAEKDMFMNPLIQFIAMSMTVFLIGVVASIISSFVLKRETMEQGVLDTQ